MGHSMAAHWDDDHCAELQESVGSQAPRMVRVVTTWVHYHSRHNDYSQFLIFSELISITVTVTVTVIICRNPGGKGCGFIPLLNKCPTGVPGKAIQA